MAAAFAHRRKTLVSHPCALAPHQDSGVGAYHSPRLISHILRNHRASSLA